MIDDEGLKREIGVWGLVANSIKKPIINIMLNRIYLISNLTLN